MTCDGARIDELRVAKRAEQLISAITSKSPIKTLPTYLTNKNALKIAARLRALAETAAMSGVSFHFWELFLNNGLYNAGADQVLHASDDRLVVSYRLERDPDGLLQVHSHLPTVEADKLHSHRKSLAQVQHDIERLRSANRRYWSGLSGKSNYDKLYEYFRYFILNTFVCNLINPDSYGFQHNGVSHFFSCMLRNNEDIAGYTVRILSNNGLLNKDIRDALQTVYVAHFDRNFDLLGDSVRRTPYQDDPKSLAGRCYRFLKSLAEHADPFAAAVLESYEAMSLDCLRIFFNFSTNVYLPWAISATSGGHGDLSHVASAPYATLPAKRLRDHENRLFQPINYPSFRSYNVEAQLAPFLKRGEERANKRRPARESTSESDDVITEDHLGPMLVWPFRFSIDRDSRIDQGMFWVSGFLRMMGRYDESNGAPLDWDSYPDTRFSDDVETLRDSVHLLTVSISEMLATKPEKSRR